MTLLQICEWLETTRVAELVTQSLYGFQILELEYHAAKVTADTADLIASINKR